MNGGVLHAVECLNASELADAESGYRFFSFDAVADLLSLARKLWEEDENLEFYERELNHDYAILIPDDSSLQERFEAVHRTRPSEFSRF